MKYSLNGGWKNLPKSSKEPEEKRKWLNIFIQKILVRWYTVKGWIKAKGLKKNATYYGGVSNVYAVYMGNNTFYEYHQCVDNMYGVVAYSNKQVKYSYLQIGLFNWERRFREIKE